MTHIGIETQIETYLLLTQAIYEACSVKDHYAVVLLALSYRIKRL